MARQIKTWLRSTMKQGHFNSLQKEETDHLDHVPIANEFISKHDSRLSIFGKFLVVLTQLNVSEV